MQQLNRNGKAVQHMSYIAQSALTPPCKCKDDLPCFTLFPGGVPAVCASVLLGPGGPSPSGDPRGAGEEGGAADPGQGGEGDPGQQAVPSSAQGGPQGLLGGLL